MNFLNANFLSPSRPVITPEKDLATNLSPFNIFSSTKQQQIHHNTSLEEAWALRVKQIQKESDPNFIQLFSQDVEQEGNNPSSPQPITPFNNNHISEKYTYPNLQTPTPFRKHLSDDVEHYKKHINNQYNSPLNGHTPFLQSFQEEKPVIGNISPPPLNKATQRSICESMISPPNHYSEERYPYKEQTTFSNQRKEINSIKEGIKLSSKSCTIPKREIIQAQKDIHNCKVIACDLLHTGLLENAVEKALECKQLILKHVGSFNEDLIYIFILIGESMTHLAKFREAQQNLLEAKKIVDGLFKSKKNTRVLALFSIQIYNDLGYLMKLQGKYKQSIEYYRKHLMVKLKYYSVNTNEVATAYTQLGVVYSLVGSFENSMECLNKALVIRENVYGKDHLETATVYNNIGNVYLYVGDFYRAYQYYRLGEGILESNNLIDHPDYATGLVNLATCLKSLKQLEEAIILYEKALNIRERILGERHSSTVSCYLMIGSLYIAILDFGKAEEYLNHSTLIREQEFGKNHTETAVCYVYLGNLRQKCQNFEEAFTYYTKAKEIYERNYGDNHPETVLVYENISSLLLAIGKGVEALDLLIRVWKHKQSYYGEWHPFTGTVLNDIGNVMRQQGRNEEAFEMYQKCRIIYEKTFGFNHEANAVVYTNLGHLYYSSYLNNNADEKLLKDLIQYKNSVDESKIRDLKINEALRLYTHAKSIRERIFGPNHIETIISYRYISLVYSAMKNYPLAYQYIINSKKLLALHHTDNEAEMKEISKVMADILRDSGGKVKKATQDSSRCPSPSSSQRIQHKSKSTSLSTLLAASESKSSSPFLTRNTITNDIKNCKHIKDQQPCNNTKDPTLYQSILSKNRPIKTVG